MTAFDRRLVPARPDLAALHLKGRVEAERYAEGVVRRVVASVVPVRPEPRPDCPLDTEAIRGETVTVYETTAEGWAWGQFDRDGYVGYVPAEALGDPDPAPTHRVIVPRTPVFPGPELKLPVADQLTEGALVTVTAREERRGTVYAGIGDGRFVVARHLAPAAADAPDLGVPPIAPAPEDAVAAALRYLHVPYVWGGRTHLGLDCSGLVQTALAAVGIAAPRDTDMQEAALGAPVPENDPAAWKRGDLVFWKGHVAFVSAPGRLLHANGHHMMVVDEPLTPALTRIAATGSTVTSVRRM